MKEEAIALARAVVDPAQKLNVLREYIQAMSLRSLHESEAFVQLAFVGGTALRFVHQLPRFSEDLDFSLHQSAGYQPEKWLKKLKTDLTLMGFDTMVSFKDSSTVHKAWIRVAGIMHDAGLAPMRDQKLSIKLEIDTKPPDGAEIQRTVVTRHRILALQHYTLPSLMAGKLHALLTRTYPKGRDWYDLLWYRGQRPTPNPNETLLQNALDQTQGTGVVHAAEWKQLLQKSLDHIDINHLREDVQPFLEHAEDAQLLSADNFAAVLRE
jgi:predicted nucleotidyltransferase component of viral defense system